MFKKKAIAVTVCIVFFISVLYTSASTWPDGKAVLTEGPALVTGIPYFDTNAIKALKGTYSLNGNLIKVLYTGSQIVLDPIVWKPVSAMPKEYVYRVIGGNTIGVTQMLSSVTGKKSYVFVEFPSGFRSEIISKFLGFFLIKFKLITERSKNDADISFPAFIDI